jgi:hypothetical protein
MWGLIPSRGCEWTEPLPIGRAGNAAFLSCAPGSYEWVRILAALGLALAGGLATFIRPARHRAEFATGV